ncbi:endolytic transglycosylase MltG [Agromyces sp. GXQ0307]|uniref:endolytic transglycosylase MltG n=1 Tax=Agromyces sp. GXQ0307 TaxID=3377835 RepID=UPI00383B6B94
MTQLPPERRRSSDSAPPSPDAQPSAPMTRRQLREMEQRQAAEAAQRLAAMEARRAAADEAELAAEAEWRAAQAAQRPDPQVRSRQEMPPPQPARVAPSGPTRLPGQHPDTPPAREPVGRRGDEAIRGYGTDDAAFRSADETLAASSAAPLGTGAGVAPEEWPPTGGRGIVTETDPHDQDPFADWGDDVSRPSRSDRRAAAAWEFEEHEREPNRRRRGAWGCLIALIVLGALVAGAAFFLQGPITSLMERFQPPEDYTGAGSGEVVFMINEGDGGETIAANLEEQDIVASSEAFIEEVTSRSEQPIFYPGAYRMANQMSAEDALDALLDPENKLENTFVIQEGLWARDALANAAAATGIPIEELEAAASDPQALGLPAEATSVEGFLFPATYTFGPDVTAEEVVQTLVDRSFQALDEAGVAPEDRWETVIIASMIEREAGSEEDAYKVSRVIRNRLDPNQFPSQLLQFDSTVHYGTGDDTVVTTTDAERADASNPYNTYLHPGLPPGPIGNPGDVTIDAAQNPADGPWLYFVTVNLETGETVFSATLEEHEAAVEEFLRYLDENG